jgi:FAD:protein FMN transferase
MKILRNLTLIFLILSLFGCVNFNEQKFIFSQRQMGVEFRYTFYADSQQVADAAVAAAIQKVEDLNLIFSDYVVDSELWRLSKSGGLEKDFKVSDDMWVVLQKSMEFHRVSDGFFDVTAGPYFLLWRQARAIKKIPAARSMHRAANKVGVDKLSFDEKQQSVKLSTAGMRLDLGGIAKGYAADEALKVLLSYGVRYALVDASGDIAMTSAPVGKWPVYLSDSDGGEKVFIELGKGAVATSGDTLQYVEIGGKRYSHIVNPKTGLGMTNRCRVTIVAQDCQTADALASTVTVMGPKRGVELIESLAGVEAFIQKVVPGGFENFKSSGFPELKIKNKE